MLPATIDLPVHRLSEVVAQSRFRKIPTSKRQHCTLYPGWSGMTWNERLAVAMFGLDGSPLPSSSSASVSVPVGAIARITAIYGTQETISHMPVDRPQVFYATMVVGLRSDMPDAGELGNDGRLGVLMDGPPDEKLLRGQTHFGQKPGSYVDIRARFLECVLPLHCVQPIAVEDVGGDGADASAEEGVPPSDEDDDQEAEPEPEPCESVSHAGL